HGLAGAVRYRKRRSFGEIWKGHDSNPLLRRTAAMAEPKVLSLFWEGFELHDVHELSDEGLLLVLRAQAEPLPRCSGCGQGCARIHESTLRRVRERDLLGRRVWLDVPVRRVCCPRCGVRIEHIPWLAGRRALTAAMVRHVEALVRLLPVRQVAEL